MLVAHTLVQRHCEQVFKLKLPPHMYSGFVSSEKHIYNNQDITSHRIILHYILVASTPHYRAILQRTGRGDVTEYESRRYASASYQHTKEQARHITLIMTLSTIFYTGTAGFAAVGKKVDDVYAAWQNV